MPSRAPTLLSPCPRPGSRPDSGPGPGQRPAQLRLKSHRRKLPFKWAMPSLILTLFALAVIFNGPGWDLPLLPGWPAGVVSASAQAPNTPGAGENLESAGITYDDSLSQPRAALVTLTDEAQLDVMVDSMVQLEVHFNKRYQYTWIFFSRLPLSEKFKEVTSNATGAACVYEVITSEQQPGMSRESGGWDWDYGLLTRERRMRDYDWFWRVEPGSELSCDVKFDIFRFMRDNNLSYGFNQAILDRTVYPSPFWERTKIFINANPEMVHIDAAIRHSRRSHRRHRGMKTTGPASAANLNDRRKTDNLAPANTPKAGHRQGETSTGQSESMVDTINAWLSTACECCHLSSTFEVGSLAFLRSPQRTALLDHLERDGGLLRQPPDRIPLDTISASIFLPRQSVWSIGSFSTPRPCLHATDQELCANDDMDDVDDARGGDDEDDADDESDTGLGGYAECLGSMPTFAPKLDRLDEVNATDLLDSEDYIGSTNEPCCRRLGRPQDRLSAQHSQWAAIARGVLSEKDAPKLMSGFTHIEWALWWNSGSRTQECESKIPVPAQMERPSSFGVIVAGVHEE